MGIEIERRFLISGKEWEKSVIKELEIKQGYLSTNFQEWITRIRLVNEQEASITMKRSKTGLLNQEFEYNIPIEDGKEIWEPLKCKLVKTRYLLNIKPGYWIVDCFKGENAPLKIAEIELEAPTSHLQKSELIWLGQEITGIKKLSNAALAKHPICEWCKKDKEEFKLE